MQSSVTAPAAHYDRVTLAWRFLLGENLPYGYFHDPADDLATATEALTRRMAVAADLHSGCTLLDVGCGVGGPARYLAREFGCQVVGISTSEVGIAAARRAAGEQRLTPLVRFEVRDGMQNSFAAASFDRVWVMESSHLMPDRGALVAECARVLRPQGRLTLCDIVLRKELSLQEVMRHAKRFLLLDQVFGRARMETLATYEALAAQHELSVDRAEDISAQTYATFARWRENAHAHRQAVEQLIGAESWQHFVDSCDVLEGFWNEGTLGYALLSAVSRARDYRESTPANS
jgi:27-O-demethylrifamycin SV methyltransferase